MFTQKHSDLPIETSWLTIAQHPDLLAVLPPDAILSLPVPSARLQGLCGFYYTRDQRGLVRIEARFCASLMQQDLFDLRLEHEIGPLFPELSGYHVVLPEPPTLPTALYARFYQALGTLMLLYAGHEQPCDAGRVYLDALATLEPESLFPYYRALSPAFFAWLRENSCGE